MFVYGIFTVNDKEEKLVYKVYKLFIIATNIRLKIGTAQYFL